MIKILNLIKRNVVIILILVLSFGAFGLSAYNVVQQPNQIQEYVQDHKVELKGDQGEKGDKGPQGKVGKTGKTGVQGAQGWAGAQGAPGAQGGQGTAGQEGCTWLGWSDWGTDLGFYCP